MRVEQLAPLTSPIYDLGASEEDVVAYWRARYLAAQGPADPGT
jgi:hypothetical protein